MAKLAIKASRAVSESSTASFSDSHKSYTLDKQNDKNPSRTFPKQYRFWTISCEGDNSDLCVTIF